MYPFTVDFVLKVVRLDVCPKGLDKPRSTLFFNTQNVPYNVEGSAGARNDARIYPTKLWEHSELLWVLL
jgi:hypothetical protein